MNKTVRIVLEVIKIVVTFLLGYAGGETQAVETLLF